MTPYRLGLGLIALLLPLAATADLTLNGRSTVVSMNMPSTSQERVYLKKSWLRRDQIDRGKAFTYIYDLQGRDISALDHSARQLKVYEMTALDNVPEAKASYKDLKLDLDPTGEKHALGAWTCAENLLEASMPAELGPEKVTLQLAGKVWLARNSREQKDLQAFFKAMDAPDFLVGIPALAKNSPAHTRALGEVLRRLFNQGMVCAIDVELKYEGGGRMAELARRMGTRLHLVYESIATDPVPDEFFLVPPGYQQVRH
ncbi:MAG: hypothetical protein Q8M09_18000 [Pseudomonadota bacterium]|nr:hypothetical protein [Pseudomonadota bacterium]MDP1906111.1 hypothetical protein [Pseudomonadota bacterium]MDP2353187.1 hypothetical protein [Pseudomonadota bacterium]